MLNSRKKTNTPGTVHPSLPLRPLALALGFQLAVLGQPVYAEDNGSNAGAKGEPPAPATLPEVNVNAETIQEDAYGPVDGVVAKRSATATKTDTPLIETPQSVTVISAEQIREQGSANLQEVLRYAAGVRNELYGVDNRGDWFSLRGSKESTTLLDGMRLPLTGYYGVVRTEPYAYERIEILRGPSSIIAGENDPGGVVNLVAKRPQPTAEREIGIRMGSNDLREVHADLTGPVNEDGSLLYRIVALDKESDTQIEYADEKRSLLAPSFIWRPNDATSIMLYGEYQHDNSKNTNAFLGVPGTLEAAPNGKIPEDLFIGEPDWDTYGGTRRRFGYSIDVALNDNWELKHQLRHDNVTGLMKSMYAHWDQGFVDAGGNADPDGEYMNRLWYIYKDESRITTSEFLLQNHFQTGSVQHTLLFGVDGMNHDAHMDADSGAGTPLNVYDPVYGSFPEPSLGDGSAWTDETEIRRVGFLLQDQMKLSEKLSVRAGIRRDRISNSTNDASAEKDAATSINIGAVYEVAPGVAPYASYSESFTPVLGVSESGEGFKPKRGQQVELGVKWEAQTLPAQAIVSVYALREEDRLSNSSNPNYYVQGGTGKVKGLEFEASAELDNWTVLGSYTYTHARATAASWGGDLDEDEQIEGIPEHQASVWLAHDFGHLGLAGLELGGGVRYVGESGDGAGLYEVPAVTLYDARASYGIGPWEVALNANNLTDEVYIATCLQRGDCWFGQRRTLAATVDYHW